MGNYSVYIHTSPNGKVYIGITCQKPERRWKNGKGYELNEYFSRAISKYGWENIEHAILFEGLNEAEACAKEIELIAAYKSNNAEYGYNLMSGGEHGTHGLETRRKLSEANKGKHHNEESKRKIGEAKKGKNNHNYGKHLSEETRRKLSEAHKGKRLDEKHRCKISESCSRKVVCIETNIVFPSLRKAAEEMCTDYSNISRVCRGVQNTAAGYHWKYYEEER